MPDLRFVDQHNMVACLEKTEENAEFHQILDFLSSCSITYALTVSPTIYASYIEQFWNTAISKTVNSVKQIHAIIDGKAVVISESSVRRDLLFNDEDGIACLTNDEIFENLALMGYEQLSTKLTFQKGKVTPLFDSMLVQNQAPEGEGSEIPPEPKPTPSTSQPNVSEPQTESLQTETPPTVSHELHTEAHIEQKHPSPSTYQRKQRKTQKHRRAKKVTELHQTSVPLDHGADEAIHKEGVTAPRNHGGAPAQIRSERVLEKPNEPPLSEGHTSGSGEGGMEHTFELTDNVPNTPHDSPLSGGYTPGSDEGRMELIQELMETCTSLTKRVLALKEAKTAQDRVITILKLRVKRLEKKRKAKTLQPMKRRLFKGRVESFNDDLDEEDASKQERRDGKTKPMFQDSEFDELDDDMDNVEGETVNTATIEVSVVSVPVTTAGVAISTVEPKTPPTTAVTAFIDEDLTIDQTLIKMRSEKAKPLLTIDPKDKGDAELAQRLHKEELAELDRAKKERQKQEEATSAALAEEFDEIQARIDANHELAVRLTHEKQEKYKIKERARLLVEFFEIRKKQLAAERAEAIRNKPPTRTQVRNRMITYLKHMGKYTHQQLKHKTFKEIQNLYEKEKNWINDFKPIDDDCQQQAESTKKRPKADSEEETPRDDVAIDVESLDNKYPIIDWKTHILNEKYDVLWKFQELQDIQSDA
ncbi:hypothetical protein Tco_1326823 [Tanacetum coccineum]